MKVMENTSVLRYFSGKVNKALALANGDISEIRMRTGRPLGVTIHGQSRFLCENGSITDSPCAGIMISPEDIQRCFEALCRYSVHSCQNQINSGFITVAGGHRAGICGSAVYSADGKIENIRNISSINFRIAREVYGASDRIINEIMSEGLKSILICGAPGAGKTTVLRDLCRAVGNRYAVSLVDERCEIAAVCGSKPYNDIGANTDVLSGFSKKDGILTAVRAMAPKMIICDEIGSEDDMLALMTAASSGVKAAATMHCGSIKELFANKNIKNLVESGLFDYIIMLDSRIIKGIYRCSELMDTKERTCCI